MNDPEIERIMQQKMRKMIDDAARPAEPQGVIELDEASFAPVIAESMPIIVDFWAEWCGPCKSMHPIVDAIAVEFAGRIRVARLNIDAAPLAAQRLGVQSIPTFIAFSKGKEVTRAVGAVGADGLRSLAARIA